MKPPGSARNRRSNPARASLMTRTAAGPMTTPSRSTVTRRNASSVKSSGAPATTVISPPGGHEAGTAGCGCRARPHREMETASTRPRLTRSAQNLRTWVAATPPELTLAAAHGGGSARVLRGVVTDGARHESTWPAARTSSPPPVSASCLQLPFGWRGLAPRGREDDPAEYFASVHFLVCQHGLLQGQLLVHDRAQVTATRGGEQFGDRGAPAGPGGAVCAEGRERHRILERPEHRHAEVRWRVARDRADGHQAGVRIKPREERGHGGAGDDVNGDVIAPGSALACLTRALQHMGRAEHSHAVVCRRRGR